MRDGVAVWTDRTTRFLHFKSAFIISVLRNIYIYIYIYKGKGKGKVIPLQARCGPEGG